MLSVISIVEMKVLAQKRLLESGPEDEEYLNSSQYHPRNSDVFEQQFKVQ